LTVADDVWSHGAAVGRPLDLQVDAESLAALERGGLAPVTLIADLAAAVLAERERVTAAQEAQGGVAGEDFFADFRPLAQIEQKLDEFVDRRPDLVSIVNLGLSLEGRPIRGVRISSAPAGAPAILLNGCQHAREWISPSTVLYIADAIIASAGSDPTVADLLSRCELFVVPVVNPDGYQYSWDSVRLWRKNRRNNGDGSFGVDLNRNWGFQWGGAGASASPSSETYRGPFAFSEPETQALRDFYLSRPQIVASIDFHSFGQLVLSPWGYTVAPSPDTLVMESIADSVVEAILDAGGLPYTAAPIGPGLYLASGNVVDWAYGAQGVKAYTIELRDTGTNGFILPPDQIVPTGVEGLAAVKSFLAETLKPVGFAFPSGRPETIAAGATTGVPLVITNLAAEASPPSATLLYRDEPNEPFIQAPIAHVGGNEYLISFPVVACGRTLEWAVRIDTTLGFAYSPENGAFSASAIVATEVFSDDFETNLGWTVGAPGDNATAGIWVRADPVGTIAQPETDTTVAGTLCFVTGNGTPGGAAGAADVDGGSTSLTSPRLDCSDPMSQIRYDRWYSNNQGGSPDQDSMPVLISNDDGLTWTQLELVTENAGDWVSRTFLVSDILPPTATVRIRFVARDLGPGSLVEAAVDGVRVVVEGCPGTLGDLDGDGSVNAADLAILLSAWGNSGGPADLDLDGIVDGADLAVLLGAWG
jgi:carboxypeptidase T